MVFSNDYIQHPLLPNSHPSSTSTSNFGLEINPFQHQNFTHEMGNFFLPQSPLYHQDPQPNHPNSFHCNQEAKTLSLSKKDRHTKILTANGVRDRRVRLSMEVAREFFDLQDMLGFDKASKTLGWLLANSESAIQELAVEKKSSGFHGSFALNNNHEDPIGSSTSMRRGRRKKKKVFSDIGTAQPSCKNARGNYSDVAREKRAKARERARERTREKMSSKEKMLQFEHHNGIGYCFSNLLVDSNVEGLKRCRFVQGDDPEGTISSLLGWNIDEMHICGQLETNQLHQ